MIFLYLNTIIWAVPGCFVDSCVTSVSTKLGHASNGKGGHYNIKGDYNKTNARVTVLEYIEAVHVTHSDFQSLRAQKPAVQIRTQGPPTSRSMVATKYWVLWAGIFFLFIFLPAKVSVSFVELLHILRSSCLKFQARRSVPLFSRNEPLPVQDLGQARINSVKKKTK